MKKYILSYDKAAEFRYDGLPLGSGDFGARVNSYSNYEDISLNLDTLWSGEEKNKENPQFTKEKFAQLREHILKKEYAEAEEISKTFVLGDWTECYLPAGNLTIRYLDEEKCPSFKRALCLETATYKATATNETSERELSAFVNYSDSVFLARLSGKKKGLHLEVSLSSQLKNTVSIADGQIVLKGRAPIYAAPNYFEVEEPIRYEEDKGLSFVLILNVEIEGGSLRTLEDRLFIENADKVSFFLTGETNYKNKENLELFCQNKLNQSRKLGYEKAYESHLAAYTPHFNAFSLSLSKTRGENTLASLKAASKEDNPYIYELMFQYARYLLITSSREDTECANLQGIWSDILRAAWSSNYTVNINTEMNYWIAEATGLSAFHKPLFSLIEKVSKKGEKTAKNLYDARGWVSHHNIDIWGHSTPVGLNAADKNPSVYGLWQMSGGWLCRHLFEHYLYTKDEDFLKNKAYPLIQGAVHFYLDTLVEKEGYLMTLPSTSPENTFLDEKGEEHALTFASTMDISILKELFTNYLTIQDILGYRKEKEVETALKKLPPFQISKTGALREWFLDYEEKDVNHRHVSHLYGLYPSDLIKDKELKEACKTTLERRGKDGTGWCIAWKACLFARLKEAEKAFSLLKNQLSFTMEERILMKGGGTYPNLFCAHPPFQIDGNFGFAAAIIEMLLQGDETQIELLPALPSAFHTGSVKGMRTKGGFSLDFSWEKKKITALTIRAIKEGSLTLSYNGKEETIRFTREHLEKNLC